MLAKENWKISRLVPLVLLGGLGLWFALSGRAHFKLGGSDFSESAERRAIPVDARGLDAVAIGCALLALGILGMAQGTRDATRIPIFWTGATLLLATIAYGIVNVVRAVVALVQNH